MSQSNQFISKLIVSSTSVAGLTHTEMSAAREFPNSVDAWKYLKQKSVAVKAQQLRQKIADDIKLIKSRKENDVTIIPVSHDLQEEWFAKLECNGIWQRVFEHLTNASDVTSAYFANDMFKNHLEKKRMMMYLPQVFSVLRENEYLYYEEPDSDDDEDEETEERNKEVLNQRLVSKKWKKAAEEQLLEPIEFSHPDWHLKRYEKTYDPIMSGPVQCKFRDVEDVDLVLKALALSNSDSCSSLLRIIDVDDEDCENPESFYAKIRQFLDIHGKSVWTFHFAQNEEGHNGGGGYNYKDFWNCVSRMPNLKEMYICCEDLDLPEDEAKRLFQEYPFPILPSLRRLSTSKASSDVFLAAEIMQKNPWLKTVSFIWIEPEELLSDLLPALSNLKLECFEFSLAERDYLTLEDIQPLQQLEWPLKVLHLERACLNDIPSLLIASEVFGILNQFTDTLEEINIDSMKLKDDDKSVVVDFPKLKKIDKVSIEI